MSEEEKSFVDKMKKRAIVKTHGIDNVMVFPILNFIIDIYIRASCIIQWHDQVTRESELETFH